MTSGPLVALLWLLYELDYVPHWDVRSVYNKEEFEGLIIDFAPGETVINMICVHQSRIWKKPEGRTGNISMISYVVVELDKLYLHMYFTGQFHQSGFESACGSGGTYYEWTTIYTLLSPHEIPHICVEFEPKF